MLIYWTSATVGLDIFINSVDLTPVNESTNKPLWVNGLVIV